MTSPHRTEDAYGTSDAEPTPPLFVNGLDFNDGTHIELNPGHVVVFVGANNVGKSCALRDIAASLRSERRSGHRVVTSVRFGRPACHPEPLRAWVRRRFPRFRPTSTHEMVFGTGQGTVNETQLDETPLRPQTLQQIQRVVTFVANAQERLALTNPSAPFDSRRSGPQTPIQALYNDLDKVERLSNASFAAFGKHLTYGHHDGRWRLRLGKPPAEPQVTGRHLFPTPKTKAEIEALDVVEEQGDGLRSYLGVLLELLAERHLFVVLDEPEAFLHPPQARQLAAATQGLKQDVAQLFVATHDSNFVRGLLDAREGYLSIIRVARENTRNPIQVVDPATISEVSRDPVLRHSNILDSMFHSAAVVCEAEADCLLYESIVIDGSVLQPGTTVQFTGSSGKHRALKTCELLRDLGVPTAVIVDFDALKEENDVIKLVHALGEDPKPVEDLLKRVCTQLRNYAKTTATTKARLEEKIAEILNDVHADSVLSASQLRQMSGVLKESGEWSELKRYGMGATSGGLHSDVKSLLDELGRRRLHVVPGGELESWFLAGPGKGASHVAHVLDHGWHLDPHRNRELLNFVRRG